MSKIAYIFDLDDTLIKSEAKIDVYRNSAFFTSLTPQQYNTFKREPGDVLDFKDFKNGEILLKAKKYKMWPFLKKLNHVIKFKKVDADILILTARSSEIKPFIHTLLSEDGIILDISHIVTMGDDKGAFNIAEEKKKILHQLAKKYSKILFFDDDIKNIQMANTVPNVETKLVENTLNEAIKHLSGHTPEEINAFFGSLKGEEKFDFAIKNNFPLTDADIDEMISKNQLNDKKPDFLLYDAFKIKNTKLAKYALEKGGTPNFFYTEFISFVFSDDIDFDKRKILEKLYNNTETFAQCYVALNKTKYLPLMEEFINKYSPNKLFSFASYNAGNPTVNKYLEKAIKAGATNINLGHNEVFQIMCKEGNTAMVKLMLKSPICNPGDTTKAAVRYGRDEENWAIKLAAENGHTDIVKLLIKDKRVNAADRDNIALKKAARAGHTDVVKVLLSDKKVRSSLTTDKLIKILKLAK